MKKDTDRYEPTLIYPSFIKGLALVRRYGINKYGKSDDWRTTKSEDTLDAMGRHYLAILMGEDFDQESGLAHLYHLGCNVMFETERKYGLDSDTIIKTSNL